MASFYATKYEDNFGYYNINPENDPDEIAFYCDIVARSIPKTCARCRKRVMLLPDRTTCASCMEAVEFGG